MKKNLVAIAAGLVLIVGSCSNTSDKQSSSGSAENDVTVSQASEKPSEKKEKSVDVHYAKQLTKADFLDKVMNYEKRFSKRVSCSGISV